MRGINSAHFIGAKEANHPTTGQVVEWDQWATPPGWRSETPLPNGRFYASAHQLTEWGFKPGRASNTEAGQ